MRTSYPLLAGLVLLFWQCSTIQEKPVMPVLTVSNPLDQDRKDAFITIDADTLLREYPQLNLSEVVPYVRDKQIAFQRNKLDEKKKIEELALVLDLPADGEKKITLRNWNGDTSMLKFPKRTQAELSHKVGGFWEDRRYIGGTFQNVDELRVPLEHTDHSFFIRYEGPGWESDLVGYRFYLDWRNATDIFGKTTNEMILQKIGQDDFESYKQPADWGMDILEVGRSLGVGTLGKWNEGKVRRIALTDSIFTDIVLNGPVQSMIRTTYYGWNLDGRKTDVSSELSITAGSRLTRHRVKLNGNLDSLCTGIAKSDNSILLKQTKGNWSYLATWGRQSLNDDLLGMAVIYKTEDLLSITADEYNEVVVLQPENNRLTYYFLGAWERDPAGITSREAFEAYLLNLLKELNNPVVVRY